MKNVLILFALLLFVSCTDKKKELIADYEQTVGDTKTDLKLKVKSLVKVKEITGLDSLKFQYKKVNDGKYKEAIEELILEAETTIKQTQHKRDSVANAMLNEPDYLRNYTEDYIEKLDEYLAIYSDLLNEVKHHRTYLERKDKTIANIWECTFTIVNPMLNNVKQEITKQYLFNADNSEIIKTIEKTD